MGSGEGGYSLTLPSDHWVWLPLTEARSAWRLGSSLCRASLPPPLGRRAWGQCTCCASPTCPTVDAPWSWVAVWWCWILSHLDEGAQVS